MALGVAAWGAIFLGAGASKVQELTGRRRRPLAGIVEAASSGNLDQALKRVPHGSQELVRNAAQQGFLHGLNEILILGAALSFAGSVLALWLVRERDIEREPVSEVSSESAIEAQPQAVQA